MNAASADRVIHTCYSYGSFSYVFKLIILNRFIVELMTEFTISQRKQYAQHINLYIVTVFMKIGNAECVQSKPHWVLTPVLSATTQFKQKTGQKCLKTSHGNLSNFITGVIEHVTRLVLTQTTNKSKKNRTAPHVIVLPTYRSRDVIFACGLY